MPAAPTELAVRKSVRLPYWHYGRRGHYFLTICCADRRPLFGSIKGGQVNLSQLGQIASAELLRSADLRQRLRLKAQVVMPNHLHCIAVLEGDEPEDAVRLGYARKPGKREADSVSSFVAGYKAAVTSAARRETRISGLKVWQGRFFEHVVRSEEALLRIHEYIHDNPRCWEIDHYNPSRPVAGQADPLAEILSLDAGFPVALDF